MPEGSGIDVLENLKRKKLKLITVVLTNFNYPQYRKKCLQLGARFFFDKSTEFAKVGEVLRRLAHKTSSSTGGSQDAREYGAPQID